MNRINIVTVDQETGERSLEGWFDGQKADRYPEATQWDGQNHISAATGSQWDHETLYHTAGSRFVLGSWSQRQNRPNTEYRFVTDCKARDWLIANGHDTPAVELFDVPDESGPGRPTTGTLIGGVRLPDALLADLDSVAVGTGESRAQTIRRLLADALVAERPYAVSEAARHNGVRRTLSRHMTRGSAVEALREAEAADYDATQRGLPSSKPRIEHDGEPLEGLD